MSQEYGMITAYDNAGVVVDQLDTMFLRMIFAGILSP
jgi:hypothetical protein